MVLAHQKGEMASETLFLIVMLCIYVEFYLVMADTLCF